MWTCSTLNLFVHLFFSLFTLRIKIYNSTEKLWCRYFGNFAFKNICVILKIYTKFSLWCNWKWSSSVAENRCDKQNKTVFLHYGPETLVVTLWHVYANHAQKCAFNMSHETIEPFSFCLSEFFHLFSIARECNERIFLNLPKIDHMHGKNVIFLRTIRCDQLPSITGV
jgi:hypothetical protein